MIAKRNYDYDFEGDSTCLAEGYFRIAELNSNGINDFVNLSPNPANDEVALRYSVAENALFKISDLNGRLLFKKEIDPGVSDIKIPVRFLNTGFYLWEMRSGNYQNNGKLIISR